MHTNTGESTPMSDEDALKLLQLLTHYVMRIDILVSQYAPAGVQLLSQKELLQLNQWSLQLEKEINR